MAQSAGHITMPLPTLTITLTLPRAYGLRMWVALRLLRLADLVSPHDIAVEIAEGGVGQSHQPSNS